MAKFRGGDLLLKDLQKVTFGTNQDANIWWDETAPHTTTSGDLRLDTTISGVTPIYSYHLTTKQYVDGEIATLSGSIILDHGGLTGLGDDDHLQYILVDGSRGFTGTVSGIAPTDNAHLTTKQYVDSGIATLSGSIPYEHDELLGLGDDDHTQYILVDGSRAFTGTVGGITPTADDHLTTKQYVDAISTGLDWQESVIDFATLASGVAVEGNRYISLTTSGTWTEDYIMEYTGTSWSGIEPNEGFATWVEAEDGLYVYNGTQWVQFGSTITHNNLSGLQGGTSDEYYHLTSTQHSDLTGGGDASSQHNHDGRYYTESEMDTTLSGYSLVGHTHVYTDVTGFNEAAQDAVGNIMSGAGTVTVTYDDTANTITVSGVEIGSISHSSLAGLGNDDHIQYVLTDGSRGFTNTVSGVTPTQDYHLATKAYVDQGGMDRHGRTAVSNGASQVVASFSDLGHTNYTVSATLENISDSPPSIYAFIVSARTSSSFTTTFMGDMDSANYVLNWSVIED